MKKWLLLLLLPLLLAGCGDNGNDTGSTPPPTETPGFHTPGHPLTEQTDGAVQVFLPEGETYRTVLTLEEGLLLARPGKLVLTEGKNMTPVLTAAVDYDWIGSVPSGIALWQKERHRILLLSEWLKEIGTLHLPEDLEGQPFLSPDGKLLYYSTGREIRVMELGTGINRPVFQANEKRVVLTALMHDGQVLRCTLSGEGEETTLILWAESGQIMASGEEYEGLAAEGGFFLRLPDPAGVRLVFGTNDGSTGILQNIGHEEEIHPLTESDRLLVLRKGQKLQLELYDLVTGRHIAAVALPGAKQLWDIRMEADGSVRFFCDLDGGALCRWDPSQSTVTDETDYTGPFYTRQEPDREGLAAVEAWLKTLSEQFGIEFVMGEAVLSEQPEDYTYLPEHLVSVYETYIPLLEQALDSFPEGIFAKAMEPRGGKLKLCLVREVNGVAEKGTLDRTQGIQFWLEQDAVVALPVNGELEQNLYHQIMHILESRIFAKVTTLDKWHTLNPKDFLYDNDYIANLHRPEGPYLDGENRYFIDVFSMSFGKEDRARIFEFAATGGNEALFQSKPMQAKLSTLCEAIRKAFDLTKYQEPLPWEQYLTK